VQFMAQTRLRFRLQQRQGLHAKPF
jgi:hypothetical protein